MRYELCAVILLLAGVCGATEYFVDKNRPDDSGAGTSEQTAFKTIQAAVGKARNNDIVTVLPGEYAETPITVADGDEAGYSSKSRLYITNSITLRSRDGAATTHIVGAYDPTSDYDGMGPNAVRCISVKWKVGAVIEGFTIRDGASRGTANDRTDKSRNRAGGVNSTAFANKDDNTYTLVDCVVSNCVGTRGGALYGGTMVRCLISDNKASNYGCAARQCAMYNCVLTRNDITSNGTGESVGIVAYPYTIVNCTFVANGAARCVTMMSGDGYGPTYNTLFVNNDGSVGDSNVYKYYNCVMSNATMAENSTDCVAGNAFELMNPLHYDFRLVEGSKSVGAGSVSHLSFIPAAYRDKDFAGNSRTTGDTVFVGAVQGTGRALSTVKFDNYRSSNGYLVVNGRIIQSSTPQYASTEKLPAMFRVEALPTVSGGVTNCPSRYWCGGNRVWPSLDDSATLFFPSSGTQDVYVVCRPTCHVDPEPTVGNDETGDGSPGAPYNTIQRAINAKGSHSDVVILAREGVYDKGGTYGSQWGVTNRVCLWPDDNVCVRVKAVGDRAKTVILGASDQESPDGTGCGDAAVRCVFIRRDNLLQGFTLKGGRTAYSSTYSDGDKYRGGGVYGDGSSYDSTIADCVITDCSAGRGAAAFGGLLIRCVITNNTVVGTGNSIIRDDRAYSCLIADNDAKNFCVVGQNGTLYNCTVASNRNSTTGSYRYTLDNTSGCRAQNCVVGLSANSMRIYNSSAGVVKNSLLETGALLSSWDGCVADDPIFVGKYCGGALPGGAAGFWQLYGCSEGVALGNASNMVVMSALDVDGNPFQILPSGKVIAGCYSGTLPAIRPLATDEGGISPEGVIPVSAAGEVTFTAPLDRAFLRFEVNGADVGYVEVGGVPSYTLAYDPATATSWKVKAVYSKDWYVDAGELGSDSNNGYTPATPFKTLAFAMKKAREGDTVKAAPGTYDLGYAKNGYDGVWMPWEQISLKSRVFIPAGRRLVSMEGAAVTFIKGEADFTSDQHDEYGRGTNAMRGVAMAQNTLLSGFTIMDGHAGCVNEEKFDNDGGGIYGYDRSAVVEDCVISNNVAMRGGGVRKGTVRRCRVVCNRSAAMGAGVRDVDLYDSLVDGNTGATATYCTRVCGCTFGPNNSGPNGATPVEQCYANVDGSYLVNNVFCDGSVTTRYASNCVFQSASYMTSMMNGSSWRGGNDPEACALKAGDGSPLLDEKCRPLKNSIVIDAASRSALYACTNESDLAGSQRVYNNALDCGAFEYDWREDYARLLTASDKFSVTSAPPACAAAPGGVLLIDGVLRSVWATDGRRARFTVNARVTGGGTLRIFMDGVQRAEITSSSGDVALEYRATGHGIDFEYAKAPGDDDTLGALITSVSRRGGMSITIR